MYMRYATPTSIRTTARIIVHIYQLNKWTGRKKTYSPAASKIKNASPKDISVMYFGKHPTTARYKSPTKNPISNENRIMSYPWVNESLVPNYD